MNLFDIAVEYEQYISELEDNGGELTPELAEKLNINDSKFKNKILAFYYVIKQKEAEIQLAKDEQQRLSDVRKAKENVIKRIKKLVDYGLDVFGIPKPSGAKGLDLGIVKVYQKKTESLEVDENANIDDSRFCTKHIIFQLTYEDAKKLLKIVKDAKFEQEPVIKISINNSTLKTWLLENEESHKELLNKAEELYTPNDVNAILTDEEIDDLRVISNAKINHNSTPIFK